ncbi:MAG: DUF4384 domain-containing protein [Acidobacteriia bacterium]|nr:DUF4384 domain-containing protein [Terriglobia bacterium]
MSRIFVFVALLCGATLALPAAQDGSQPQLTARELFYSAVKPPPAAAQPTPPKPPPRKKSVPPPVAKAPAAPPPAAPAHVPDTSLPDGGRIVQASVPARATAPAPAAGTALGLRYAVLKKFGDDMIEVPPDTTFHAGDRMQFRVQTNGAGHLYIVSQGSSGTWKPIFPSAEVEDGDNHVEGLRDYTMPPGSRMVFDEQAGIERIFIVFSRNPEPDLEKMIYSLQGRQPVSAPKHEAPPKHLLVAGMGIDDATVGRLRTAYGRDLVIEKVDPSTSGEKKENAVYVVNASGSADSRVVADLKLVHQ